MGNVPSSEELIGGSPRRRLSRHKQAIDWVQIAGEHDYDGLPTPPVIGASNQLSDAVPTIPTFALLHSQGCSGNRLSKNSPIFGQYSPIATGYYDGNRPSCRSTDAAHPMGTGARASGSARAASMEDDPEFSNDAENRQPFGLYFSATPGLSSSSSTGSSRTLSSDSGRELPLYIPYRRHSVQRIPGQATRAAKAESGVDKASYPPKLPATESYTPYLPSRQTNNDLAPLAGNLAQEDDFDEQDKPSKGAYQQLGSIKLGSLRITNGSPLSMRRGGENASEVSNIHGDMMDYPYASSSTLADSHNIWPLNSCHTENPVDPAVIEYFTSAALNTRPREVSDNMHRGHSTRRRQQRMSSESPMAAYSKTHGRAPSDGINQNGVSSGGRSHSPMPSVIDDEQLKLIRRRQSTRVTSDDASSTYSLPNENETPIMSADNIVQHKHASSDTSHGPHLSFQSFRNLIRQNRVKSYLEANNKLVTPPPKVSHQRSVSDQDPPTETRTRSTSRPRRKLTKKNPFPAQLPLESGAATSAPPETSNAQSGRQNRKGHFWSKSDGEVPHLRSSTYSGASVPPVPQQVERSPQNHTEGYHPSSERVPIVLDQSHLAPRARVSFEELSRQRHKLPREALQDVLSSKTVEFKPLPTPNPELPPKRTPVRVPMPIPTGFGAAPGGKKVTPREPRNWQGMYPPMPSHVRSHTIPLVTDQYTPYQDWSYQDDDELQRYSSEQQQHDSPYVSPLSDDDQDLWPITTQEASRQTMKKRPSTFQPREVSPIRHAKSMPNIRNQSERQLRTPAPISAHSRRAQAVATRRQQPPPMPQQWPVSQTAFSAFYEDSVSRRPRTAGVIDEEGGGDSPFMALERETNRDDSQPPVVYRNGQRRGAEMASSTWQPPYRILHSYYSPAYRNAPIWG